MNWVILLWVSCLCFPISPFAQGITLAKGPVKKQLYARNADDRCLVPLEGSVSNADQVVLNVYKDAALLRSKSLQTTSAFSFSDTLPSGLAEYHFEILSRRGNVQIGSLKVDSVLCGDAFVIYGQSNAEAFSGWSQLKDSAGLRYQSQWIRSYQGRWVVPNARETGAWGMHVARLLLEKYRIPVAIINAARGNTTIKELSPEYVVPASESLWVKDLEPYGNFYKRMVIWTQAAGLTQGIKAILWHQGEKNVYGSNFTEYRKYDYYQAFMDLRAAFYKDFPALKKILTFQIKTGCGADDIGFSHIFETQRKLANDLPDVDIMSTLNYDIVGCHLSDDRGVVGYTLIGNWIFRQIDSIFYRGDYKLPISPPNLIQAAYTSPRRDSVVLLFDQDIQWNDSLVYDPASPVHIQHFPGRSNPPVIPTYLKGLFAFDSNTFNQVVSGSSSGRRVYLKLKNGNAPFKKIAYPYYALAGTWPGPFLTGPENGLGALGFYVTLGVGPLPVEVIAKVRTGGEKGISMHRLSSRCLAFTGPGVVLKGNRKVILEIRTLQGKMLFREESQEAMKDGRLLFEADNIPEGYFLGTLRSGNWSARIPLALFR